MTTSIIQYSEAELLQGLCDGDPDVFTHLEQKVKVGLRHHVMKSCPKELVGQEVDDLWPGVVEDAWIKVKEEKKVPKKLVGYMIGIGKNKWAMEMERRKRSKGLTSLDEQATEDIARMSRVELVDLLLPALDMLDKHCQEVLSLGTDGELNLKEVAIRMGHTYGGLRTKKSECMKKLRKIISQLERNHRSDD